MIENEYKHNKRFRDYVDKYTAKHGITVDEALEHAEVRAAFQHYRDV